MLRNICGAYHCWGDFIGEVDSDLYYSVLEFG